VVRAWRPGHHGFGVYHLAKSAVQGGPLISADFA
jgi:hypothetical protein